MATVVEAVNRPTLVIAHNKTLAAQLYSEFKEFFPHNAVEYFVTYYDYYQPEAYIPRTDTYIEKDSEINEEIDRLRLAATSSLLSRRDVLIVASVSCIYGLGDPEEYGKVMVKLAAGRAARAARRCCATWWTSTTSATTWSCAAASSACAATRWRSCPPTRDLAYRIEFLGDEVERITEIDPLTGEMLASAGRDRHLPGQALHHAAGEADRGASTIIEAGAGGAARAASRSRTSCWRRSAWSSAPATTWRCCARSATAPASRTTRRHLALRPAGAPPWTLLDYFPADFLLIVDESHMTLPQVRGMYNGDRARKAVLVDYGFRLPVRAGQPAAELRGVRGPRSTR